MKHPSWGYFVDHEFGDYRCADCGGAPESHNGDCLTSEIEREMADVAACDAEFAPERDTVRKLLARMRVEA